MKLQEYIIPAINIYISTINGYVICKYVNKLVEVKIRNGLFFENNEKVMIGKACKKMVSNSGEIIQAIKKPVTQCDPSKKELRLLNSPNTSISKDEKISIANPNKINFKRRRIKYISIINLPAEYFSVSIKYSEIILIIIIYIHFSNGMRRKTSSIDDMFIIIRNNFHRKLNFNLSTGRNIIKAISSS